MLTNHSRRRRHGLLAGIAIGASLFTPFSAHADWWGKNAVAINGGGAVASSPVISTELLLINSLESPKFYFNSYYPVTSTQLQNAIINNDPTQFGLGAGSENVDFGATEQPLTSAQIASWSVATTGQAQAGNLIQIPIMGAALAIPLINGGLSTNGQLALNDNQLCGIFSGKISDWDQISTALTPGPITVVYRTDTSALSYQLTHHLAAVCSTGASGNSNFAANFVASTLFSSVFPAGLVPNTGYFVGISGLGASAAYLSSIATSGYPTSGIGYISPDWTSYYPYSEARLPNGKHSQLLIASLVGGNNVAYLPSIKNIILGLENPGAGAYPTIPPENRSEALSQSNWLPQIPLTRKGYSIVSYSSMLLPQCFNSAKTAAGLEKLLDLHYVNPIFILLQQQNGYAQIANTPAASFLNAVVHNILKNVNYWDVNIQNTSACAGLPGR